MSDKAERDLEDYEDYKSDYEEERYCDRCDGSG